MKFIVLFLLLTFNLNYSQNKLKLNDKSPKLNITNWIENIPSERTIENKYLVLEFWATWCSPCLQAVPHLNYLQSKFNQDNLIFISITNEEVRKIKKILEIVKFNSCVVSDMTGETQKNFGDKTKGLEELPLTVLIDNKSIVKWIGKPKQLNEEIMISFLNDEEIPILNNLVESKKQIQKTNFEIFLEIAQKKDINYFFEITKSNSPIVQVDNNKVNKSLFYLETISIKEILTNVLDYNKNQFSVHSNHNNVGYNIFYKNNNFNNESQEIFEKAILNVLNIKKEIKKKNLLSNNITILNKELLEYSMSTKESSIIYYEDKTLLFNYTIKMLCDFLNKNSDELFHFYGNNNETYNFTIDSKDITSIFKSIEGYGIITNKENFEFDFFQFSDR